jgi:hypothetical protein
MMVVMVVVVVMMMMMIVMTVVVMVMVVMSIVMVKMKMAVVTVLLSRWLTPRPGVWCFVLCAQAMQELVAWSQTAELKLTEHEEAGRRTMLIKVRMPHPVIGFAH